MNEETTTTETPNTKTKVMGKINEFKSNIGTVISDLNVADVKKSINALVKDAQRDFNKILNRDIDLMKKKLKKEKLDIEKRAKKFLDGHKKDLASLQAKFDKLVKTSSKLKAAPAKKATAKKATKKVAKKTATKKATKKVARK